MNAFISGIVILTTAALFLSACQTTQPSTCASKPEAKILSSLISKGKGIPNGRSDSTAPFLRGVNFQPANDPEYGYSQEKPIRIGKLPARSHIFYLNTLRGPNGEAIEYERKGSCCEFNDKSLPLGGGLLDVYKIKVDGSGDEITLYVDMYRLGPPQLPVGFTIRK